VEIIWRATKRLLRHLDRSNSMSFKTLSTLLSYNSPNKSYFIGYLDAKN